MKSQKMTLLVLGGMLNASLLAACSDGETGQRTPGAGNLNKDGEGAVHSADDAHAGPSEESPDVIHGHVHEPGSEVISIDASQLPALPKNVGDRLVDIAVRIDSDGTVNAKMFETTFEARQHGAKLAMDFAKLMKDHRGKLTVEQRAAWRESWGLPSLEESQRLMREVMDAPFDIMLQGELDEGLRVELDRIDPGLEVLVGAKGLAANGFSYTLTTAPGSGTPCNSYYHGVQDTVFYYSGTNFSGTVLCVTGAWNDTNSTHNKYFHWDHSAFIGTHVHSYVSNVNWFGSRTSTADTGTGVGFTYDTGTISEWIDNMVGSCVDPVSVIPACWS